MPNHRKSIRLENYDYAASGTYFITLVTWNRKLLFGEITKGDIHLNPFGEIVQQQWLMSEKIRKEIILDEFIIMPNHFHAIVVIRELSKFSNLGEPAGRPYRTALIDRANLKITWCVSSWIQIRLYN